MKKTITAALCLLLSGASFCTISAQDEALITSVDQLSSNCTMDGQSIGLPGIIDNNTSTFWHSTANVQDGNHWLQIDLGRTVSKFYYIMDRRQDNWYGSAPIEITIKGTNTPDDESSWQIIRTLSQAVDGLPNSWEGEWPFTSPDIQADEPVRYLRFYFLQGPGRGGDDGHPNKEYVMFSELQIYDISTDYAVDKLRKLLFEIFDLATGVRDNIALAQAGAAGFYTQESAENFTTAFTEALNLMENNPEEQEAEAAYEKLLSTYEVLKNSYIPLKDGLYYIVSAYRGFTQEQPDTKKAMQVLENQLQWSNLYTDSTRCIWEIADLGQNQWGACNQKTLTFIGSDIGGDVQNSKEQTPLAMRLTSGGQWELAYDSSSTPFSAFWNAEGTADAGTIALSSGGEYSPSAWYLIPVTDSEIISQIGKEHEQMAKDSALIVGADQLSSACTWSDQGSLAELIDNKTTTYWHSSPWSNNLSTNPENQWIQVDLGENSDVNCFYFTMGRRMGIDDGGWINHGETPTRLQILVSDSPDGQWTELATITDFPDKNDASGWPYISDCLTMSDTYRYIRFKCIEATNSYWTFSELQLYKTEPAPTSFTIHMSDEYETACFATNTDFTDIQNMEAYIITEAPKDGRLALQRITKVPAGTGIVVKGTPQQDYIIPSFDGVCDDVSGNRLVGVRNDSTIVAVSYQKGINKLITDSCQLSASGIYEDHKVKYLIDNDINTIWHSTAQVISGECYLQAELNDAADHICFTMNKRYNTPNASAPSKIAVLGSTDGMSFNEVCTLTRSDKLPLLNSESWPYTSKIISSETAYTYWQFRFEQTTGVDKDYTMLSEFQIYDADKCRHFILTSDNGKPLFMPVSNEEAVMAGHAFLALPESVMAGSDTDNGYQIEEVGTGISAPSADEDDSEKQLFDLSGKKVENPTHGIYITKGKKIFVK